MKFTMARLELVKLVGKIQSVVAAKPAIPILVNILIEAYADQIIVSATDLTVSIRTFTDAKVLEEGAITVPARHLFQLVRELTAPQVEISCAEDDIVHIVAGSSHFKLNGMEKSEFPALPDFAEAKTFAVNGDVLKGLLSKTAFAAARDDARHVLNGILMTTHGQSISFTATDGKRLSRAGASVDVFDEGSYILPLKAVEEIVKSLETEDAVKVMIAEERIAIDGGGSTFMTKLLSGDYPDIERVIPKECPLTVHLHRDELISCLKQVSLFTTDRSHSVRFQFLNGELKLMASSSDLGEGSVAMPVDYNGEMLEIAFNPNYFLDMLRHSKDETVSFSMSDPYNPGLVTDKTQAQFVIMPMRIEQTADVA